MDLAKYISLLQTRALYLASLSSLPDHHEGMPPQEWQIASTRVQRVGGNIGLDYGEHLTSSVLAHRMQRFRGCIFVNCWHLSSTESAGMWREYTSGGAAVALACRVRDLRRCLGSGADVRKIDYSDKMRTPPDGIEPLELALALALRKRTIFQRDQELRVYSHKFCQLSFEELRANPYAPDHWLGLAMPSEVPLGISVALDDMQSLAQEVRVHVNGGVHEKWVLNVVERLHDSYGVKWRVTPSELGAGPPFCHEGRSSHPE